MPFTKEQYQEYYQKIKEERNRKRREKYLAQKVRVDESQARQKIVNPKKEVDETLLNQVDEIKVDEKLRERVDEKNVKSEVDEVAPPKNKVDENAEPLRNVEPKIVNQVELELAPNVESVNASKNKNKAEREEQFKSEVIKISRIIPDEFLVKTNAPRKMVEGKEYFCINGRWEPKVWSFELELKKLEADPNFFTSEWIAAEKERDVANTGRTRITHPEAEPAD